MLTTVQTTIEAFSNPLAEEIGVGLALTTLLMDDRIKPDDIAVLLPTKELADHWHKTLTDEGLPVRKKRFPVVPDDWPIAVALLNALETPTDDSVCLTYIRLRSGEQVASQAALRAKSEERSVNAVWINLPPNFPSKTLGRLMAFEGISPCSVAIAVDLLNILGPDQLTWATNRGEFWQTLTGQGIAIGTLGSDWGRAMVRPVLFLPAMEEGLFSIDAWKDMALRVRNELHLSWSRERNGRPSQPSRFLKEVEA